MIIGIIICLATIFILQLLTPFWWWIIVIPFIYGVIKSESGLKGFGVGMISTGLLWLFGSLYYFLSGSSLIAKRVSIMMKLGHPLLLILITTLLAFLVGGFSGSSGYFLKRALNLRIGKRA